MANNEFIGRRVSLGLGLEGTPGTAAAPTLFMRHTKFGVQRKVTRIENDSAIGRVEKVNDSAIVERWAEGPIEGKVYDLSIGALLANMFSAPVTTDNADTNPVVKDHTFDISQSSVAKTLTVAPILPSPF